MVASSERHPKANPDNSPDTADKSPSAQPSDSTGQGRKGPHGKRGQDSFPQAAKVYHDDLGGLKVGDPCRDCGLGRLYKFEPSILIRITAHAPYEVKLHVRLRLLCNRCQKLVCAHLSDDVLADGAEDQRFRHSARAMMALQKYSLGMPFKRQEELQKQLGLKITASTIYDQCERLADTGIFIQIELSRLGESAASFCIDDTNHRIRQKEAVTSKRSGKKKTAVYSSALLAELDNGHSIVLFKTNVDHDGDYIDEILEHRNPSLLSPLVMSDALSSNRVTSQSVRVCLCNVHARRMFLDLYGEDPAAIDWILRRYQAVYKNEEHCSKERLSPKERLAYHQEHSLPAMEELRSYVLDLVASGRYGANSNMGKAISYFNKNWEGLTGLCRWENPKLDNNPMERALRTVVLGRKNFYFYQSTTGARVSDIVTSLIATCKLNDINLLLYLTAISSHHEAVKKSPGQWLPWNYPEI